MELHRVVRKKYHPNIKSLGKNGNYPVSRNIPLPNGTKEKPNPQIAKKQILDFFDLIGRNWENLFPKGRITRRGIAARLVRQKIVTGYQSEVIVIELLKKLEIQKEIELPPKSKSGGPRIKGTGKQQQ